MGRLFDADSGLMRGLSRMTDLVLLNLLFILTSIPIVTIGASTSALYSVFFRWHRQEESGYVKAYFHAFARDFKEATLLWLAFAAVFGIGLFDIWFFTQQPEPLGYVSLLFCFLSAMVLFVYGYAIVLVSLFANSFVGTLKNALLMSVAYFPRTLGITCFGCLPVLLVWLFPGIILQFGWVLVLFAFSGVTYLNSLLLRPVILPMLEKKTESSG